MLTSVRSGPLAGRRSVLAVGWRRGNFPASDSSMNSLQNSEMMYRFRHFRFSDSEEHRREPERIVCDSQFWCSDPRAFNDPFDCRPNFIISEIPAEEAIRRAQSMIRRRGLAADHPQALALMNSARAGRFNSFGLHDGLRCGMQEAIHRSSVCCFDSLWDDPRMWAQYADDHRGYCLAFELDGDWPVDAVPMPVRYSDTRPEIDLAVDTMEDRGAADRYIEDSIFTKSSHWLGEKELRIFRPDVRPGLQAFPPSALKAVYLGLQVLPENRDRLIVAVRQREHAIPVYQLHLHATRYELELEQIN